MQLNENYSEESRMKQTNFSINLSKYNFTNFKFPIIPILGANVKINNTIFKDADMTNIRVINYKIFENVDFETYPPKAFPRNMEKIMKNTITSQFVDEVSKNNNTKYLPEEIRDMVSNHLTVSNMTRLRQALEKPKPQPTKSKAKTRRKRGMRFTTKSKTKKIANTISNTNTNISKNTETIEVGKRVKVNGGRYDEMIGTVQSVTTKKAHINFDNGSSSCLFKYKLTVLNKSN